MAEKSTFFNSVTGDRKYKAEDMAAHFAKLITNGVYPSGTQLQATEDTGMDITISAGSAWINGYAYHNDNDFSLTFDAADGVLNRIDRIVVRWGRVARSINLAIIKGTPASSPTAPGVVRSADYYDLSIATVSIAAGITAITQAMITDTRGDNTVCGFVSSLIEPDTSGWFEQFDSAFNAWFETVQAILDEEVAGNLLNLINDLAGTGRTTETVKGNAAAHAAHVAKKASLSVLGHVKHGTLSATIPTTDWTGSEAPYSKEITVTGMLATDKPIVDVDLSEAEDYEEEQAILTAWGLVYRIVTDTDKITVYATEVPETETPIALKVVR